MCGRVRLTSDYSDIKIAFRLPEDYPALDFPPRWNGAPGQQFPFIHRDELGEPSMRLMRWGLIPAWAKDEKISASTFNASSEDLAGKPAFGAAWKAGRRGVLPLDGFYEWEDRGPKGKQPHLISRAHKTLMAVAGLWETKRLNDNDVLHSFTIITTAANKFMSRIHDRMPVILSKDDVLVWLGETGASVEQVAALMRPAPEDWLEMVPVDPRMSDFKNQGEEYCQPIALA